MQPRETADVEARQPLTCSASWPEPEKLGRTVSRSVLGLMGLGMGVTIMGDTKLTCYLKRSFKKDQTGAHFV